MVSATSNFLSVLVLDRIHGAKSHCSIANDGSNENGWGGPGGCLLADFGEGGAFCLGEGGAWEGAGGGVVLFSFVVVFLAGGVPGGTGTGPDGSVGAPNNDRVLIDGDAGPRLRLRPNDSGEAGAGAGACDCDCDCESDCCGGDCGGGIDNVRLGDGADFEPVIATASVSST